jgi:hypothetical protein
MMMTAITIKDKAGLAISDHMQHHCHQYIMFHYRYHRVTYIVHHLLTPLRKSGKPQKATTTKNKHQTARAQTNINKQQHTQKNKTKRNARKEEGR